MTEILLRGDALTRREVVEAASRRATVRLDPAAARRMEEARRLVDEVIAEGRVVYGITTGFGALSTTRIELLGKNSRYF